MSVHCNIDTRRREARCFTTTTRKVETFHSPNDTNVSFSVFPEMEFS